MSRAGMYAKMGGVFLACALGGPAIMYAVTPSEGELFKRFSPDLQKRNLEMREERTRNYEDFVSKMKEYSKDGRPIWIVAEEDQQRARREWLAKQEEEKKLAEKVRLDLQNEIKSASRA